MMQILMAGAQYTLEKGDEKGSGFEILRLYVVWMKIRRRKVFELPEETIFIEQIGSTVSNVWACGAEI